MSGYGVNGQDGGCCSLQEKGKLPISAVEYVKEELGRISYFEHRFFEENGCFTEELKQLQMDREPEIWPEIEVTSSGFMLSCVCPEEEKKVILYDDGRVEILDRNAVEKKLRHIPYTIRKQASEEELPYLEFLYRNMPLLDLQDCEEDYFLRVVRQALYVREHTPWGKNISEEIFCNYVLPYRINNEHLVFYQEIFWEALQKELFDKAQKERSLYQAAVEVNYWCLKQATYQSTNERTASPFTVLNNAFGRCGEESTLAVAALRSVGIPARQCYAPRWSHCDDNHAWVEVYAEDGWHFLGACEPELRLDRGWFEVPSSKAMLVHTKVYTDRLTEESKRLIKDEAGRKELNILDHYARTRRLKLHVTDETGKAVAGARVRMEVVNYSEFSPVMILYTDCHGEVEADTGWGDLLLHVSKDGAYARGSFHGRQAGGDKIEIVLGSRYKKEEGYRFTFLPPVGIQRPKEALSAAEAALEKAKYEEAVRVRKQKESSFYQGEAALREARLLGNERLAVLLEKARGNWEQIRDFLKETPDELRDMAEKMLFTMEEKDLSDTTKEVLREHLESSVPYANDHPEEVFVKDVLNPRIHLEVLTAYKAFLQWAFTEEEKKIFRQNPAAVWTWIRGHIFLLQEEEKDQLRHTPLCVWKAKAGNSLSLKVLFVAICRSIGIPARMEETDGSLVYYHNGVYCSLSAEEKEATLCLRRRPDSMIEYAENVTIGRLEKGEYKTLRLEGLSWKEDCLSCPVTAGIYRIIVTNRQPDESNLVSVDFVELKAGETVVYTLEKPCADRKEREMELSDRTLYRQDGSAVRLGRELFAEESGVLCYINVGSEPAHHLLNEIAQRGEYFKNTRKKILLVIRNESEREDKMLKKAVLAVGDRAEIFTSDEDFPAAEEFAALSITDERFPLVIVTRKGKATHAWSGYQVGIADMLLKCL